MKRISPSVYLLTLLLTSFVYHNVSAELTIVGVTKVKRDKMVRLEVSGYDAKAAIVWRYDKKKLDGGKSGSKLWLVGPPGEYQIEAMAIRLDDKGTTVVEEAEITLTIGDGTPDPGPTPKPPDPVPPVPPEPFPAPIPDIGFRVLIVWDKKNELKMPKAQQDALYDKSIRDYLRTKCVVDKDNPNGSWKIWPSDSNVSGETSIWQGAWKRERKSLPWILISDGKKGFEGPLPATAEETLNLLKKYGG